jgi:hypothetical protein
MSNPDEEYERAVIAEFDAGDTEATLQAMAAEAKRTEADFEEYHRDRAFHAWKQAMWAKGLKLPTQVADGRVQRAPRYRCILAALCSPPSLRRDIVGEAED